MKIAIFSPFQRRLRRGIERFTSSLARQLALLGEEVLILSRSGPLTHGDTISSYAAPCFRYFESRTVVPFFVHRLRRFEPDVVILYFAAYGEASTLRWLDRHHRPRTVFIAGYPMDLVPHRFEEFRTTGLNRQLDGIVAKASHMAEPIAGFFGKPVEVIPNGVDIDYFRPGPDPGGELPTLVTVAALEKRKGIEPVIEAMPRLLKRFDSLHYEILGEGPERARLEEKIQALGLEERIHLRGAVADVRPFLRRAQIYLLLSEGEGLPNSLLEAMASGLPAVLADAPPYDAVTRQSFARRVDPSNRALLVDTITELLQQGERRRSMAEAARKEAETVYSWPRIAERYRSYLEELRGEASA